MNKFMFATLAVLVSTGAQAATLTCNAVNPFVAPGSQVPQEFTKEITGATGYDANRLEVSFNGVTVNATPYGLNTSPGVNINYTEGSTFIVTHGNPANLTVMVNGKIAAAVTCTLKP